jgi:multidrug efflux system membrane fusion protein
MNRQIVRAGIGFAALAAWLAAGCREEKTPPPMAPGVSVVTTEARLSDVPMLIESFGETEELAGVDVVPQVSGVLLRRLFDDGATVTNGQPLFQIDPSDYAARVKQAEGLLAAARAELALSRGTETRYRSLLEQALIAQEDFDSIRARAEAAAAQVRVQEAALEQARLNLDRCTILSPIEGVCSRHYVDAGNLVVAGQTRLTNIRSRSPIEVNCSVSERHLSALRKALAGGPVPMDVRPRGDTNRHAGVVQSIDNAVNRQSGTLLVRGRVANENGLLWPGQFVDVRIVADTVRGAVMVPEGAVLYGKQGPYLFAVTPTNTAALRQVSTGLRYENQIQVTSGVAAGERIVVLGQLMLADHVPVREANPAKTPGAPETE